MIDYLITSLPRSGSAWLSNLLTDNRNLCAHEGIFQRGWEYWELNHRVPGAQGICDTSLWGDIDTFERHKAPKLVVVRDPRAVNMSLKKLGLGSLPLWAIQRLHQVSGQRLDFEALFDFRKLAPVVDRLTGGRIKLCAVRHAMLKEMYIERDIEPVIGDLYERPATRAN